MRSVIHGTGEFPLSLGVVVLLFLAYLVWGSAWRASSAQHHLAGELNSQWPASACARNAHAPARPDPVHLVNGQPFAITRIPAFGPRWQFTLVQGTSPAQLNVSPGRVPGTQLPGQPGNFAVAGHRVIVTGILVPAAARTCAASPGMAAG